ncbi:hypothetical protein MAC_09444 [Metarhizium acridum CQMa 102]|uniref:Uncharacterized protein n=1 Tax=Metarhizium acridum (strain CQMa 102) TaxID=655827 RepID=E9EHU6_METAQ|nr:uncharacterized protein MAC_09444 [Metarhizium acridum CQMa 102]EFY84499.1 hypothetical protein MAC_09444 [Metarhizium acridum CQMa 102]
MSNASVENSTSDLLTLIITTSPTLSAPSTELLSAVLTSFRAHCAPLLNCSVIVVFDACEQITAHPRLKKGYVTPKSAQDYDAYKKNVKHLFLQEYLQSTSERTELTECCGEAEYGSPYSTPVLFTTSSTADGRVTFIEAAGQRLGFGLAVRTALRAVGTPYVWVHQHDWALIHHVPIAHLLGIMRASELDHDDEKPIKYVWSSPTAIPLTPMFFWHDKPHIASTAHYLQRVFPSRLAMMRGAFIEDTIGQRARSQMKEGQWAKWATWLYNPRDGKQVCLRHLHGRTWRGEEEETRMKGVHRERNLAALRQLADAANGNADANTNSRFLEDDSDTEISLDFLREET